MSEPDRRHRMTGATSTRQEVDRDRADAFERGRAAYRLRSWTTAYELLSQADEAATLGGGDLELLARSAYLSGRAHRFMPLLERAYRAHVVAGDVAGALRCAHWLGLFFLFQGKPARASGWLARARRSLERSGLDCVEAGYLITLEHQIGAHDLETAHALAERAAGIGERFADADLVACARQLQGKALILAGRMEAGLALLDEAMTAVTAGEVSPLVSGLLYCSVIDACLLVFALDRAREWTSALASGAPVRRNCSRSPGSAGCVARKFCSCKAPGRRRSKKRGVRGSWVPAGPGNRSPPRRVTRRAKCTGCAVISPRPRTRTVARVPIGPYSHIAVAGPFVAISGTAGVDAATGELAGPDVFAQTWQILKSFRAMLESVGSSMGQVLHVQVFLRSMDDFEEMNRAYREAFNAHLPARTVVGVSALPREGALLTMSLTAVVDGAANRHGDLRPEEDAVIPT